MTFMGVLRRLKRRYKSETLASPYSTNKTDILDLYGMFKKCNQNKIRILFKTENTTQPIRKLASIRSLLLASLCSRMVGKVTCYELKILISPKWTRSGWGGGGGGGGGGSNPVEVYTKGSTVQGSSRQYALYLNNEG